MLALALAVIPIAAQAGMLEGATIGPGSGMLIAGPPGAIVGGVIGATSGMVPAIVNATVGAVLLLFVLRGWDWNRRW